MSSIVDVLCSSDSWVDQAAPSQSLGHTTKLSMSSNSGSQRRVFFAFPIAVAPGGIVLQAKLRMYVRDEASWAGSSTLTATRVTQSWKESRVNWNNQPSVIGTGATVIVANPNDGDLVEIDVTSIIQSMANGGTFFGIRVQSSGNSNRSVFSSEANNPDVHPVLHIEWADQQDPPEDLAPDGGRAVSTDTPLLTWRSAQQSAYHYQIFGDETLTDLLYDSGWVISEISESVSGYSLADGEDVAWRVQTRDELGIETDYSDVASFVRDDLGVLTITSPAGPDPGTVDESTPPFIHTFTGTQVSASWELQKFITSVSGNAPAWVTIWEIEKHDTTDTSVTPPNKIITSETTLYRLIVRVWDDVEREGITGAPAYAEEIREFMFARTAGVAAVSTITVVSQGAAALIHWTRGTTPDSFSLVIDGEVEVEPIDPADVLVSTNNFEMLYYGQRPNHTSTYEIRALDSTGKHSTGNPTANFTQGMGPAFIFVPSLDYAVPILGGGVTDTAVGMDYEVVNIPGRRDPVKITSRVGGYEGTIEGYIQTDATWGSADTQRHKLEVAQGLADTEEVRVSYADHNFPVILEPITFTPEGGQKWHVVIPFIQIGSYSFTTVAVS